MPDTRDVGEVPSGEAFPVVSGIGVSSISIMLRDRGGAAVVDSPRGGDEGKSFWNSSPLAVGESRCSCTPCGNDLVLPGVNTPVSCSCAAKFFLAFRFRFDGGAMICKSDVLISPKRTDLPSSDIVSGAGDERSMTSFLSTLDTSPEAVSILVGRRCKFSSLVVKSGKRKTARKRYLWSKNILHPFQNTIPNLRGHHHLDGPGPLSKRIRLRTRSQHPCRRLHMVPYFRILPQRPLGLLNIAESPNETFDNSHIERDLQIDSAVGWGTGAVLIAFGKVDKEHESALVGDFFDGDVVASEAYGDGFIGVIKRHAMLCTSI